jgi:hypothetical protein
MPARATAGFFASHHAAEGGSTYTRTGGHQRQRPRPIELEIVELLGSAPRDTDGRWTADHTGCS